MKGSEGDGGSGSIFNWIRNYRVTHRSLLLFLLFLAGLWALFTYTDLWYVLFP